MSTPAELPPMPGASVEFAEDDQYKGTSTAQDRAIEALHRNGWSLHRAFTEPSTVLPLPPVKFPEGRVYLIAEHVALVVEKHSGRVIASLPTRAALRTLDETTPDVLEDDEWASAYWERTEDTAIDVQRRWHKQSFHDVNGSHYTVRRTADGTADVIKDGAILHEGVRNADEADELDLEPAIVELIDYVIEHP